MSSSFDTPGPITLVLDLFVADVQILASDRTDTSVEVLPSNPGRPADVKAAEATRVEFDDASATLSVISRKPRSRFVSFSGKRPESIDVVVRLPSGSAVRGEASVGDFAGEGALGAVQLKSDLGDIRLAQTGDAVLRSGLGEIVLGSAIGAAEIHSGSGGIRTGVIGGTADITSSNGPVSLGTVTGRAQVKASNGPLSVDRALGDITATAANGEVRIGSVVRGKVTATSKNGRVEVGVLEGSAAWLDLDTTVGKVYNELDAAGAPDASEPVETVEVRASTKVGNIMIRRAK